MKKYFLIVITMILVSCSSDNSTQDPILCTEEARPGLIITIIDGSDGMFLKDGVTVTATDMEYRNALESIEGNNTFFGAIERPGTYVITVSRDGYKTFNSDPIVVEKDLCHVITEVLEVVLEKL